MTIPSWRPDPPTSPTAAPASTSVSEPVKTSTDRRKENKEATLGCLVLVGMVVAVAMVVWDIHAAWTLFGPDGSWYAPGAPAVQATSQPVSLAPATVTAPAGGASPTTLPSVPPTAVPTTPAAPEATATPCGSANDPVPCNPWGYDFNPVQGSVIPNPQPTFCDYFNCIASFWNGTGWVVECLDNTYSKSGSYSPSGVCSKHIGLKQTLYQHP